MPAASLELTDLRRRMLSWFARKVTPAEPETVAVALGVAPDRIRAAYNGTCLWFRRTDGGIWPTEEGWIMWRKMGGG